MPDQLPMQHDTPARPPAPRRGGSHAIALGCWLLIIALAAGKLLMERNVAADEGETAGTGASDVTFRFVARHSIGTRRILGGFAPASEIATQLRSTARSVDERICFIIVTHELLGADAAVDEIARLERDIELEIEATQQRETPFEVTEDQRDSIETLSRIYTTPATDAEMDSSDEIDPVTIELTDDERDLLIDRYDWFGKLALVHARDVQGAAAEEIYARATWTAITVLSGEFGAIGAVVVGFVGLIITIVLLALKRTRTRLAPSPTAFHIYAETFVIWFLLFLGLLTLVGMWNPPGVEMAMAANALAFFASLSALVWPILRGVRWRDVRCDIGWTSGRGAGREVMMGAACYVMAFPIIAVGFLITLFLFLQAGVFDAPTEQFGKNEMPAHPIVDVLSHANPLTYLLVLLLGAVAAPIVEETVFRGVLYRNLRDWSRSLGTIASVAIATIVNTFLFAIIHPQGVLAVPVLMSLAIAFTLAREWRGTLIAPICMHAMSNGIVLTLAWIALSGAG